MSETLSLPRLQTLPSLGDQTYRVILDAIVSLEFRPGERMSVHRLSEQLGVSRTPVKDAFQRLEQEGLVSVVPRTGTFVSSITTQDIDEILEARGVVEGFAALRAAGGLTPDDLEEAETLLGRMGNAIEEGNTADAAEIGHGFHEIVISQLHNERMEHFLKQIDLQYTRIRRILSHRPARQRQSLEEHRQILETLKAQNGEAAYTAMYDHHWSVRDELVTALENVGGGPAFTA